MFEGVFEGREPRVELDDTCDCRSAERSQRVFGPVPVPSGATLSLAGSAKTEFSDSWLSAIVDWGVQIQGKGQYLGVCVVAATKVETVDIQLSSKNICSMKKCCNIL